MMFSIILAALGIPLAWSLILWGGVSNSYGLWRGGPNVGKGRN